MLGIEEQFISVAETGINPVEVRPNLKAVSIALAGYEPDRPIIWRGPAKTSAIRQFLGDVNWEDLDFLIVDSPPGTGDEPLSVCQLIPNVSGIIIVTTPRMFLFLMREKAFYSLKKFRSQWPGSSKI
jgi:Mrp family chromosome partitioning ATPase